MGGRPLSRYQHIDCPRPCGLETLGEQIADASITKDAGGRYYPDTQSRTQGTPDVSELSDCPVDPSDQPEHPGQSKFDLSGLSGTGRS